MENLVMIRSIFQVLVIGMTSQLTWADKQIDAEQVRAWVSNGTILPFQEILKLNQQYLTGKILDLDVEKKQKRIVYEIEHINHNGEVTEVYIDAVSGRFIKEEREN